MPVVEPSRNYNNFQLADDGEISYVYKGTVIDLGNINERLKSPWEIRKLGVNKLRSVGFMNIIDEDVQPHGARYKRVREKAIILNENLNERLKAIESPSTIACEQAQPFFKHYHHILFFNINKKMEGLYQRYRKNISIHQVQVYEISSVKSCLIPCD